MITGFLGWFQQAYDDHHFYDAHHIWRSLFCFFYNWRGQKHRMISTNCDHPISYIWWSAQKVIITYCISDLFLLQAMRSRTEVGCAGARRRGGRSRRDLQVKIHEEYKYKESEYLKNTNTKPEKSLEFKSKYKIQIENSPEGWGCSSRYSRAVFVGAGGPLGALQEGKRIPGGR